MTTEQNKEQQNKIPEFKLIAGIGNFAKGEACIMSAAVAKWRISHGADLGKATDTLKCVDPVIRRLAININDRKWWKDDDERTKVLMPLVDKLIGTAGSKELMMKRAYRCVDKTVREIAPVGLDAAKWDDLAKKLRGIPPIVDKDSCEIGRDVSREVRDETWKRRKAAAAAAAAYADAYAAAAAAAYADAYAAADADAAADAAAYAAAYADAYADAAADAAAAADADAYAAAAAYADAKKSLWDRRLIARGQTIDLLIELCEMGEG